MRPRANGEDSTVTPDTPPSILRNPSDARGGWLKIVLKCVVLMCLTEGNRCISVIQGDSKPDGKHIFFFFKS